MSHGYIISHQWLETDLGDVGAGKGEGIGEAQKGPRVEVDGEDQAVCPEEGNRGSSRRGQESRRPPDSEGPLASSS